MLEWSYNRRMRELLTYLIPKERHVDIPVANGPFPPEAQVVETARQALAEGWIHAPSITTDAPVIRQVKITSKGRAALANHLKGSEHS